MGFPGGSVVKNPPAMQVPQETWVQSLGMEDPLEEEMATHSCILARIISWTEEPDGLQSMGLPRVGHDLRTKQQYVCLPDPETPSYIPPHSIPLGCPRALALGALLHALNLH